MSSAAFTPGPWLIEDQGESQEIVTQDGRYVVAWTTPKNAALLHAAPDLYAHLRFAVKLLSALPAMSGTAQVEAMRAALAKAEGRS